MRFERSAYGDGANVEQRQQCRIRRNAGYDATARARRTAHLVTMLTLTTGRKRRRHHSFGARLMHGPACGRGCMHLVRAWVNMRLRDARRGKPQQQHKGCGYPDERANR